MVKLMGQSGVKLMIQIQWISVVNHDLQSTNCSSSLVATAKAANVETAEL